LLHPFAESITPALREVVRRALPGATLKSVEPLRPDQAEAGEGTEKGAGYGIPLRLLVQDERGRNRTLVFHTATADVFGHDRRADRAQEMLLGFDTFSTIPRHVAALDVGAIRADGAGLVSLGGTGEFYLLTSYANGHVYAEELRRIAHAARLEPGDVAHSEALARYLAELHAQKFEDGFRRYVRSLRDLTGSGEGIAGIVDGYPDGVPSAPRERLEAIERRALEWRFRLRGKARRLSRVHGDYHPFNVVFDESDDLALLDAARGSAGDPADDVTCMAINYVFFAVEAPGAWKGALGQLWHRFWDVYLEASGDDELLSVAAPFLAWRGLVVCNPVWYPRVDGAARDRVLQLIERTLEAPRFDPDFAEALFA
jgi:aminoglycoside phosphotransferase (APT) family kinase protein